MKLKKQEKAKIDYPIITTHRFMGIESIKSFAVGISIAGLATIGNGCASKDTKKSTEPKLPHTTSSQNSNENIENSSKDSDKKPITLIYDLDKDGIADNIDKCPSVPEDKDGFQDEDGCPDPDNDKDGIFDINDKCPNKPENKNGYMDEDGCPDHRRRLRGKPAPVKRFNP